MESSSESIAHSLWAEAAPIAQACLYHPFVQAIGAGNLPLSAFQAYICEDAYFLTAFLQAYAYAITKCPSSLPQVVHELADLLKGCRDELGLHAAYAARWGVSLHSHHPPAPATLEYTSFLLHTAQTSSTAEILAAMTPCMRLYAHLGVSMKRGWDLLGGEPHQFDEWVGQYASPAFEEVAGKVERLLDATAAAHATGVGRLKKLYVRAMQCEYAFFDAHFSSPLNPPLGTLCVNFDGTCTLEDSVALLPALAVQCASSAEQSDRCRRSPEEIESRWMAVKKQYADGYKHLMESLLNVDNETPPEELDIAGLSKMLGELAVYEHQSNEAVVTAGVLAGVPLELVAPAASALALRPSCLPTLTALAGGGVPVRVISSNWSDELVRGCMHLPPAALGPSDVQKGPQRHTPKPPKPRTSWFQCFTPWSPETTNGEEGPAVVEDPRPIAVVANSLTVQDGVTTGSMTLRVQGPLDKGDVFEQVSRAVVRPGMKVYVGDSVTDLAPMLAADLGVIMGPVNPLLKEVAAKFHLKLLPLVSAALHVCRVMGFQQEGGAGGRRRGWSNAGAGVLYVAESWAELAAFLGGRFTKDSLLHSSLSPIKHVLHTSEHGPGDAEVGVFDPADLTLVAVVSLPAADSIPSEKYLALLKAAVSGGATAVQLRVCAGEAYHKATKRLIQLGEPLGALVPVLVQDRSDVALTLAAAAVISHSDDVAHTRKVLGSHCCVGAVVTSVQEASHASSCGAVCLCVPGIFAFESEDSQQGVDLPIRCEGLAQICAAVTIPVLAKGGVNCVNAAQAIAAGATGIAVELAIDMDLDETREHIKDLHSVVLKALAERV